MEKQKLLFVLLCLVCCFSVNAQKIITVNNNPGASADFSSLQAAIDDINTVNGDTLYISGSSLVYDGTGNNNVIRLNKSLTLIGPGYLLAANNETQFNKSSVMIDKMVIGEGANGSIIMGINSSNDNFSNITIENLRRDGSNGNEFVNNILITRCYLTDIDIDNASNVIISKNYITTLGGIDITDVAGIRIENNIFYDAGISTVFGEQADLVIENNTFYDGDFLNSITESTIRNNIFVDFRLSDCDNNDIRNNVFTLLESEAIRSGSNDNNLSNNIFGANPTALFVVLDPSDGSKITDNELLLGNNSAAKGAGINGVDAGAFGGSEPYRLSGIPPFPAIYDLETSGVGSRQQGLNVTIKVKSNN